MPKTVLKILIKRPFPIYVSANQEKTTNDHYVETSTTEETMAESDLSEGQTLFVITRSLQGAISFSSPLPPKQALKLLVSVLEDLREMALRQGDGQVQVVPSVPGLKLQ
jgi:hypothetical protein